MKAEELYRKLNYDFITDAMSDEWFVYMHDIDNFICDNFKKRSMGLVCDFSDEINEVITAVFPSEDVMQKILNDNTKNALLFVHHPSIWDITKAPEIFYQMDKTLLKQFKQKRISIYNLHVPLDAYGQYSTSVTLAKAIELKVEKPFGEYHGILAGVICEIDVNTLQELQKKFAIAVNHDIKLYKYGNDIIRNKRVAVVAGGGNDMDVATELMKENINVLITGVSVKNNFSQEVHDFEKQNKINVMGGTHYSTEKFACIEMCDYFTKLGLQAKFISEKPTMQDM